VRRLRILREEAHLSRTQLSYVARVYGSLVGQIELGRLTPPRGSVVLRRLAAALDYSGEPGELLDDLNPHEPLVGEAHPTAAKARR
jgi:transcriptional regulator with XRE-family HTH domain